VSRYDEDLTGPPKVDAVSNGSFMMRPSSATSLTRLVVGATSGGGILHNSAMSVKYTRTGFGEIYSVAVWRFGVVKRCGVELVQVALGK
jgi:hypothetical protein